MTDVDYLAGVKATLTLPTDYDSPYKASYFNFYLGMNFTNGLAVEAGISYGNIQGAKLWRVFTNPGLSMPYGRPPGSVELALFLTNLGNGSCIPRFLINGTELACAAAGKLGKIKMVAAIHEDISDTAKRKTYFNQATFCCTGVLESAIEAHQAYGPASGWKPYSQISGLNWHVQRPPEPMHKLISCASSAGNNFTITMAKPTPPTGL